MFWRTELPHLKNKMKNKKYMFYAAFIVISITSIFVDAKILDTILSKYSYETLSQWFVYPLTLILSLIFVIGFISLFTYIAFRIIQPDEF